LDLRIKWQKCVCGALLVPPKTVSSIGEEAFELVWEVLPETPPPMEPPPEVPPSEAGEWMEQAKATYIATRAGLIDEIKRKIMEEYGDGRAKSIVEEDLDTLYRVRVERYTALVEGSEEEGYIRLRCPRCGFVTFEWRRPRA
jgi:hypothetical protein